jgi:hypothetical protein
MGYSCTTSATICSTAATAASSYTTTALVIPVK